MILISVSVSEAMLNKINDLVDLDVAPTKDEFILRALRRYIEAEDREATETVLVAAKG